MFSASLDPDEVVGYRGSLARGFKGPHKGNAPFDPADFDVDAFIVSDKLSSEMEPNRKGQRLGNNHAEIKKIKDRINGDLAAHPCMAKMRENLQFHVNNSKKAASQAGGGDIQIKV